MINVRRCDQLFRQVIHSPLLGELVGRAARWPHGVRVAQDQVWMKPPGSGPLSFHRDSPYFDFDPDDVCTLWLTLDDLSAPGAEALGPLQYCARSHRWGDAHTGSANQFFADNYKALLLSAAQREGLVQGGQDALDIVTVRAPAGGYSIHNGRLWHGSGPNTTDCSIRTGVGIHYVPAHACFSRVKAVGRLWRPYLDRAKRAGVGVGARAEQDGIVDDEASPVPLASLPADFPLVYPVGD